MTAVAGTVFIAAGAFWLSFTSLADLARRSGIGAGQAWAWPLIVDGIIVVATVAVVALAGTRTSWYPWALLIGGASVSVAANAIHAVIAADADVPGILAGAVAAVPPIVLLAITHLTVILGRSPHRADIPPAPQSSTGSASERSLSTASAIPLDSVYTRSLQSVPFVGWGSPDRVEQRSDPATARRRRAARLREAGWSNKQIARQLGVHPSTVGRWLATADTPVDTTGRLNNQRAAEDKEHS
jgi:hypothetical protein